MFLKMQNMFFWERLRIFRGKKNFLLKSGIDTFFTIFGLFLPVRVIFNGCFSVRKCSRWLSSWLRGTVCDHDSNVMWCGDNAPKDQTLSGNHCKVYNVYAAIP